MRNLEREATYLAVRMGTSASEKRVDTKTLRLPIMHKFGDAPIIRPSGLSWMSGAVFDGRPIVFEDRKLIYFCGQSSYRTDNELHVGIAEWIEGRLVVDSAPVLWPDIENRGIDIPAFTVWRGAIVAAYLDDYGSNRTGRGYDTALIVAQSSDGRSFRKARVKLPFESKEWTRIGLPWLLADDSTLYVYWRGKAGDRNFIVQTELSGSLDRFIGETKATPIARNPINVAVTKRNGTYILFYGASWAGGIYVAKSHDGLAWDFSKETMLVGTHGDEWGWDYYKVCGSPDNSNEELVEFCYLANNSVGLSIGLASFHVNELLARSVHKSR